MNFIGAVDVLFDMSTDKDHFSGTHSLIVIVLSSFSKHSSKKCEKVIFAG